MSKKTYSRLTHSERRSIEQSLKQGNSLCSIARSLNRNVSTISREITRNSVFRKTGGFGTVFNNCSNRKSCEKERLCSKEDCNRIYCCGCEFCFHVCKDYVRESCPSLKAAPYVCNGCKQLRRCTLEKAFYKAGVAEHSATTLLSSSRQGIDLNESERARLDSIVTPLVKQGQSPYHICLENRDALMISDKTLYKYISANLFEATNTDLLRKVKMKPRKSKPVIKIERACRTGRTYRDFLDLIEEFPDISVVQMDTVIGKPGSGEKVLLTIHFPQAHFMLAFIREANTARSVCSSFDHLKSLLQYELFCELFPVVLTDNGPEFSAPSAIETDKDGRQWTKIFYCEPYCSYQKAAIESNHRLIRMFLPKGKSMNSLSQADINHMLSHINSYARKSLGGKSPFQVFKTLYGDEVLKMLGLKVVSSSNITLNPSIFL